MVTPVKIAFKEWASVVEALARGNQILILRKGGIQEKGKKFTVEHSSFFLFPTYEHQKEEDLNSTGQALLKEVISKPPLTDPSRVVLTSFAEMKESFWVEDFEKLSKLSPFHVWSENALRKRFGWGEEKGIHVLIIRVFKLREPRVLPDLPAYAGCRSWVDLEKPVSLEGMEPVLTDREFNEKQRAIVQVLSK